jgi:DNA-binding NtrC family response regulator
MSLIEEARTVRQRVAARLAELEPLVREYEELRKVADELGVDSDQDDVEAPPAPTPPVASSSRAARRSSGRRRSGGAKPAPAAPEASDDELSERVLAAVSAEPGQTVADYARVLGVPATALYRPVRELTTAGAIVKRARQFYPA